MIGETLGGRYQILQLLGQGGMGAVYEAVHTGTGRRVAVKVITAGLDVRPAIVARFEVEARAAGRVESRHIAQVFDVGRDEARGVPYLVMEFLIGEDLHQLIRRLGALPPLLAVRVVAQACRGLEKAHAANIIHRDIKPANLFLTTQEDDTFLVKVLDFGVAKIRMGDAFGGDETGEGRFHLTSTGALLGSPLYMSPEQARGIKQIDNRTDLWSLGVVLFQCLTGRTPFQHIEAMGDLIISLCSTPAPSVQEFAPWVAPEICEIVRHALEIPADKRFQTAREFYEALKPLLQGSINIESQTLAALPDDERSFVAPKTIEPGRIHGTSTVGGPLSGVGGTNMLSNSSPNAISGTSDPGVTSAPGLQALSTQSTTAVTNSGVKSPPRRGLQVAIGIATLAAVSAGVVLLRSTGTSRAQPAATGEAVSANTAPLAPSSPPSAAPSASASATTSASASASPEASATASATPAADALPDVPTAEPHTGKPSGGRSARGGAAAAAKSSAKPVVAPPPGGKTVDGRAITKDL